MLRKSNLNKEKKKIVDLIEVIGMEMKNKNE